MGPKIPSVGIPKAAEMCIGPESFAITKSHSLMNPESSPTVVFGILIGFENAQSGENPVVPGGKLGEFRHGTYPSPPIGDFIRKKRFFKGLTLDSSFKNLI